MQLVSAVNPAHSLSISSHSPGKRSVRAARTPVGVGVTFDLYHAYVTAVATIGSSTTIRDHPHCSGYLGANLRLEPIEHHLAALRGIRDPRTITVKSSSVHVRPTADGRHLGGPHRYVVTRRPHALSSAVIVIGIDSIQDLLVSPLLSLSTLVVRLCDAEHQLDACPCRRLRPGHPSTAKSEASGPVSSHLRSIPSGSTAADLDHWVSP